MSHTSPYDDMDTVRRRVGRGCHRDVVGGLWEELGSLQCNFLRDNGLKPEMRFLDVACGCLRAGVHLVPYLNAGNYYGIDSHKSLIEAGYEKELEPLGLASKVPRANLLVDAEFNVDRFSQTFHMAIAQSLFTHVSLNTVRQCLTKISRHLEAGASLFATFFECPPEHDLTQPYRHSPGNVITHDVRNPYHYLLSDMEFCATGTDLDLGYVGEWGHPRGQMMLHFHKRS